MQSRVSGCIKLFPTYLEIAYYYYVRRRGSVYYLFKVENKVCKNDPKDGDLMKWVYNVSFCLNLIVDSKMKNSIT